MSDPMPDPMPDPKSDPTSNPKSDPVADLLALLDLERLELDLFRGNSPDGEASQRVFGGQVIAQALVAAYRTVEDRTCHSLHAYFIRPGDPNVPIIYEVDRARDGRSFTTRRVIAVQHGKQIFNMAASFQVTEDGWEHQDRMPQVPGPQGLKTREDLRKDLAGQVSREILDHFTRPRPVEMRPVDPQDFLDPKPMPSRQSIWFRVAGTVADRRPELHHALFAYASDMSLLDSGARPHAVSWFKGDAQIASLDHAMWFHQPVKADEWHLYDQDSPSASGARSFNRGAIYASDGTLVCSVAQEGLMRPRKRRDG